MFYVYINKTVKLTLGTWLRQQISINITIQVEADRILVNDKYPLVIPAKAVKEHQSSTRNY